MCLLVLVMWSAERRDDGSDDVRMIWIWMWNWNGKRSKKRRQKVKRKWKCKQMKRKENTSKKMKIIFPIINVRFCCNKKRKILFLLIFSFCFFIHFLLFLCNTYSDIYFRYVVVTRRQFLKTFFATYFFFL